MRLRGFLGCLLLSGNLALLPALSQTSQPPAAQTPAAQQAPAPAPASPESAVPAIQQLPLAPNTFSRPDWRKIAIKAPRRVELRSVPRQMPDGPIDSGIFVQRLSGLGRFCGSIVSYNFSPGANPQLEGVTTCTPASAVQTLRTRGKAKTPPGPQFRTTAGSPSQ